MFMEMRLAALIHKPGRGPRVMPAKTVFEMATLGGAAAMGQSGLIGSIEPGKKADLALVSTRGLHCTPQSEAASVYASLVYEARASDVVLTMVDGRVVYREGVLKTIDEEYIRRQCESLISKKYAEVF
jgi:cytosine/adenosine deaminase-related metal-dependent hydrolase